MMIDLVRTDVDKLIEGLKKFSEDYDKIGYKERYIELQFVQSEEYLIVLRLDKKGKITQ